MNRAERNAAFRDLISTCSRQRLLLKIRCVNDVELEEARLETEKITGPCVKEKIITAYSSKLSREHSRDRHGWQNNLHEPGGYSHAWAQRGR